MAHISPTSVESVSFFTYLFLKLLMIVNLTRNYKFSVEFKSGEQGGRKSSSIFLTPLLRSESVEYFDACDGALPCVNIMDCLNATDCFLCHSLKKVSSRNRQ